MNNTRTAAPLPCPICATRWVDRALASSRVALADDERRRLIAALLARPHLLLSGPAGVGKRRLIRALAEVITEGRPGRMRAFRGHPWWAAETNNVTTFVTAQANYNIWRLLDFVGDAVQGQDSGFHTSSPLEPGVFIICVEEMSPVEVDFYFRAFVHWWPTVFDSHSGADLLRVFGTVDCTKAPYIEDDLQRTVAVVHLRSHPIDVPSEQRRDHESTSLVT